MQKISRRNHYWWIACLVAAPYIALLLPYTWRTVQRRGPRIGLLAWAGFALIVGAAAHQPSQVAVAPTVSTVTLTSSASRAPAPVAALPPSRTTTSAAAKTTAAKTTAANTLAATTEATPATAVPVAATHARVAAPPAAGPPSTSAQGDAGGCGDDAYVNSDGNCIERPTHAAQAPAGATALCRDGTYSFSAHHSGTCSHHGGVAAWL